MSQSDSQELLRICLFLSSQQPSNIYVHQKQRSKSPANVRSSYCISKYYQLPSLIIFLVQMLRTTEEDYLLSFSSSTLHIQSLAKFCGNSISCIFLELSSLAFSGQIHIILWGFPGGSEVKVSTWNAGDPGLIPGSGRSPGEGNGTPLQYSCLENPMEGGAWLAITVHGVAKSRTRLDCFTIYCSSFFKDFSPEHSCPLPSLARILQTAIKGNVLKCKSGVIPFFTHFGGGLVSKLCPSPATPWTIACQAPLSMGLPRQECWSGLPFPSSGDLPNPGIEPEPLALAGGFFTNELPGKPV